MSVRRCEYNEMGNHGDQQCTYPLQVWVHLVLGSLVCSMAVNGMDEVTDFVCVNCLCDTPMVNASSVHANFYVYNTDANSWQVDVNITWNSPDNRKDRHYAVRLTRFFGGIAPCVETYTNYFPNLTCYPKSTHSIVFGESFFQEDVEFGYRLYFEVGVYDKARNVISTHSTCISDIYGPDCYEETSDLEFCQNQPIYASGKVVNLSVEAYAEEPHDGGSLVAVMLGWSRPIQLNGDIRWYSTATYNLTTNVREGLFNFQQDSNSTIQGTLTSLQPEADYRIEMRPFAQLPNGDNDFGLTTKLFLTTPSLSELRTTSAATSTLSMVISDTVPGTTTTDNVDSTPGPPGRLSTTTIIIVVCGAALVAMLLTILIACVVRYVRTSDRGYKPQVPGRKPDPPMDSLTTENETEKSEFLLNVDPVFREKEVPHSRLEVNEKLGSGQFGVVYKGLLRCPVQSATEYKVVAVKTVKCEATLKTKQDFLGEIRLMLEIGRHRNILGVIACCTASEPFYMITEYLQYGDLLHFLRKCNQEIYVKEDCRYDVTDVQRYHIALQIARGMCYVSSQRYYHGDLAARNILLGQGLVAKISDFGLASDIYQRGYKRMAPDRVRPIKWASLETNLHGTCTIRSDIWSFGVVLYEIFTNGQSPYKGMGEREVIKRVKAGYRMDKPDNCPDDVYTLMLRCWKQVPSERPSFEHLSKFFDEKLSTLAPSGYIDVTNDDNDDNQNESPKTSIDPAHAFPTTHGHEPETPAALSGESAHMTDCSFVPDESGTEFTGTGTGTSETGTGTGTTSEQVNDHSGNSNCTQFSSCGEDKCVYERDPDDDADMSS